MTFASRLALAVTIAVTLGLGSAWFALHIGQSEVVGGPWRMSVLAGPVGRNVYARARVALRGLLALSPTECMEWNASTDSNGTPFDGRCDYRVEGPDLPARWWSLIAYGSDGFLMANESGRLSFNRASLAGKSAGMWNVGVSVTPQSGHWLPLGRAAEAGGFMLTLRLYSPDSSVRERPLALAFPRIVRERCR